MIAPLPGLFAQLYRVVQRVAEEEVSFAIIAGILLHNEVEFFTEVEFLHRYLPWKRWKRLLAPPGGVPTIFANNVKTIHAFQLRAEAKHASQQRQLPPRLTLLLAAALLLLAFPAGSSAADPGEELQAAKLMEAALFARQADAEEWRKLERVYAALAAKYPADAAVKNAHAEWLWSAGEHERAVEAWQAAEKIEPENAVVLDHLGGSFLAAGDAKQAATYYARATASAPENAAFHYNYANVAFLFRHELLDADRPDAAAILRHALTHFADAARLEPLNPEYARAYAETFYTVPDPDWPAALRAWQHFHEISPQKDFALLNLARVHLKLGNRPEARESLAQIQNPEFDSLKNRLQERIDSE